jgi:hypothetical protein
MIGRNKPESGVCFSFTHPVDASPAEIALIRAKAMAEATTHSLNRRADWRLNDVEAYPGPIIAIRLRDGRFMDCEDGPEVLGLSWEKHGEPDDVVEYLTKDGEHG